MEGGLRGAGDGGQPDFPFPTGSIEFCEHALFGESLKFSLQQLLTFVVDIGIDLARRSCAFAPVSNNVETHVAWMSLGMGSRVQSVLLLARLGGQISLYEKYAANFGIRVKISDFYGCAYRRPIRGAT